MSICTFLSADVTLPEAAPSQEYPLVMNVDCGTVCDGDADDNFYLIHFDDVGVYTDKKYGVYLEWNYTDARAEKLIEYIKTVLSHTDVVELWHVWLMDYYEYEDRPVIHKKTISICELKKEHMKEITNAAIWNSPDKMYPDRPSFYRFIITRG